MQINREIVTTELDKFISNIFLLPEVYVVKIRDVIICRDEVWDDKLQKAMDKGYHDCYSDVDLSIVVKLSSQGNITSVEYMKHIDRFGINADNCLGMCFVAENNMYRIILKNGMRYDFGFEFDYDDNAECIHIVPREEEWSNPSWSIDNVNQFWFLQIQALGKLYRKDFLISAHLANMNLNETLVQQMVLRDIERGTNHHRYGYEEELAYMRNKDKCPIKASNDTFNMIADKLYCAALTYDELMLQLYPEYKRRSQDFFEIWKCYEQNRTGGKV